MRKVAVITDSTACIPNESLTGLPVFTIPLQLIFGQEVYLDGVDITLDQFYQRLPRDPHHPSTSQPSPEAFQNMYQTLLDQGYDIVAILISSRLSGTWKSAQIAKLEFPHEKIAVIDSMGTSMTLGFQVLTVARAAAQGMNWEDCVTLAEKAQQSNTGAFFTLQTLEYLRRGGRIGSAAAFLGTALNLKPILALRDGVVEPVDRVRTSAKAYDRMIELFIEKAKGYDKVRITIVNISDSQEVEMIREKIHQALNSNVILEELTAGISPVIGTHTGPGTVGIVYMLGM